MVRYFTIGTTYRVTYPANPHLASVVGYSQPSLIDDWKPLGPEGHKKWVEETILMVAITKFSFKALETSSILGLLKQLHIARLYTKKEPQNYYIMLGV